MTNVNRLDLRQNHEVPWQVDQLQSPEHTALVSTAKVPLSKALNAQMLTQYPGISQQLFQGCTCHHPYAAGMESTTIAMTLGGIKPSRKWKSHFLNLFPRHFMFHSPVPEGIIEVTDAFTYHT